MARFLGTFLLILGVGTCAFAQPLPPPPPVGNSPIDSLVIVLFFLGAGYAGWKLRSHAIESR